MIAFIAQDRMMIRGGLVLAAALFAASAANAEPVSIIGDGEARRCFEAARDRAALKPSIRMCDAALRRDTLSDSDRAATFVNRGIVRMHGDRLAAAIADFDTAIARSPDMAEAYINKGIALLRLGNREDEARATLSQGIARNPARPEIAYYQRAIANETLGRVREAYEDYSRAAALAPDWADPVEQLQRFQAVRAKTLAG